MIRISPSVAAAVFVFAVAADLSRAPAAAELPSYAATYEIRLTRASATTGPRAAVGTLDSVFNETCDGWETRTRTVLDLAFRDSSNFTNERYFDSWESKTGRDYKFSVHTFKNGQTIEAFQGRANLKKAGGEAYYEAVGEKGEPSGKSYALPLPEGTMLPVEHAKALLDRAERGASFFRSVVLNGVSRAGPRILSVAIGEPVDDGETPRMAFDASPEDVARLLNAPAWRMSSARFNLYEGREMPDTELFLQLHKSGVTESFEQTFSDFSLSARLIYLRYLDPPQCDK